MPAQKNRFCPCGGGGGAADASNFGEISLNDRADRLRGGVGRIDIDI